MTAAATYLAEDVRTCQSIIEYCTSYTGVVLWVLLDKLAAIFSGTGGLPRARAKMGKLKLIDSELQKFQGFLHAAQHVFRNGELTIVLEAYGFEILDNSLSDQDVIVCVYPFIADVIQGTESSVENIVEKINRTLTIQRRYWKPKHVHMAKWIENQLRDGYWKYVQGCIDLSAARVVDVGDDVPWVNIGDGFAYILYNAQMSRCILLVGNSSD